ncbi:hypothetical protein [Nioella sp. MMSF_3534]|uniref:hypothetical protein n=1 Tax=Nioella sp. MMSF_3534 TaxID=3046720 RepID=UPI00273DCC84|nr:hypothetical protein [Nioella sp. MMSF_3534]
MIVKPHLIKVYAILLMVAIGVGLYIHSLRSDFNQFIAMLERVMPGYNLSSEVIGRELIVASTFAVEHVSGSEYRDPINSRATSFVSQYDGSGLPPLTLLFVTRESGLEYWEIEFQGCSPGECDIDFDREQFEQIDEFTWASFTRPPGRYVETELILEEEINGTQYRAFINLLLLEGGEVIDYSVVVSFEARNLVESFIARIADGNGRPIVHSHIVTRNLALEFAG